jgi:cell division septum initiation protein DivIVA
MNIISREEEIFETPSEPSGGNSESKLTSHKESLIDRPAGHRNEDIIESKLNPDAAYGVFNGRMFQSAGVEYYSLADNIERRIESPLQRFARLRGELDELTSDLNLMVESEAAGGKANSTWAVLQREAMNLASSADNLSTHKGFELVRNGSTSHERALSGIVRSMEELSVDQEQQGATGPGSAIAPQIGSADLISVEQRVHRLETLLGSASNLLDVSGSSSKQPYPLLETVKRLEERAAALDVGELESLRVKCEAVRAELEGTLKSKSTASAEAKVTEAARQLSGLLALAQKVDAVVGDLPALVLRLKTLEHVHSAAASFTVRLGQTEQDVRALSGQLASNRDVLVELKSSLRDSVTAMQQNVTAVNAKIASLQSQT